jgi:hypothetical protein
MHAMPSETAVQQLAKLLLRSAVADCLCCADRSTAPATTGPALSCRNLDTAGAA